MFEGSVLALLPGVSRPDLAAAFLGYRLIYYRGPWLLASVLIAGVSLAPSLPLDRGPARPARPRPALLAATAFALGAVLILTGIAQIDPDRLQLLEGAVPVLVLETSHLVSLVAGLGLMGVAISLFRRRAQAVPVAMVASAIAASTRPAASGLDIGPSISAAAFGLALFASRGAFRRRGAWRADGLMCWWLLGLAAVVAGAVALGLWVYEDTPTRPGCGPRSATTPTRRASCAARRHPGRRPAAGRRPRAGAFRLAAGRADLGPRPRRDPPPWSTRTPTPPPAWPCSATRPCCSRTRAAPSSCTGPRAAA